MSLRCCDSSVLLALSTPTRCCAITFPNRGSPGALPGHVHSQKHLPVVPAAVTVGVSEHLHVRETHIKPSSARLALPPRGLHSPCLSFAAAASPSC